MHEAVVGNNRHAHPRLALMRDGLGAPNRGHRRPNQRRNCPACRAYPHDEVPRYRFEASRGPEVADFSELTRQRKSLAFPRDYETARVLLLSESWEPL